MSEHTDEPWRRNAFVFTASRAEKFGAPPPGMKPESRDPGGAWGACGSLEDSLTAFFPPAKRTWTPARRPHAVLCKQAGAGRVQLHVTSARKRRASGAPSASRFRFITRSSAVRPDLPHRCRDGLASSQLRLYSVLWRFQRSGRDSIHLEFDVIPHQG